MGAHNLVVRSDHLKGGLGERRRVVRLTQYAGRPILVDPKGRDFSGYAGASMVTPNGSELQRIVDAWRSEEELAIRAPALRALLGIASLLLTR